MKKICEKRRRKKLVYLLSRSENNVTDTLYLGGGWEERGKREEGSGEGGEGGGRGKKEKM